MLGFLKSFSSNIHYKYSVQSRPSFEAGCWTVYDAKHKTTNDPVSVFVFNKKAAAEIIANNGLRPRSATLAEVWEFASRGVQQLTKIRHPAILKLVEPLETSKNSLTFVTERVVGPVESIHESDLDELSVVRGLTTVVQALQFLHTQLGVVHCNISPHTVFSDLQGDWKIAGFEFMVKFEDYTPGSFHLPLLDPRMPSYMHPAYDYLAPELVLKKTVLPANDVWSLACLLYAIYMRRSPLQTRNNPSGYKEELVRFRQRLNSSTAKFPANLQPYLASLFCEEPEGRITLDVLETTDFFQNPLIKALKFLDEYSAKPAEEKLSFLKHFQTLIPQLPKQMRVRKIVKFAAKELSGPRDPVTGALLGNVLFTVCADMSKLSFQEQVLPLFAKLHDYFPFQESVASNLEVISRNTSDKDFSKSVLPLLVDLLKHHDAQHAPVQVKVLQQASVYAGNITVSKLEETMFPAVIDCFAQTPNRPVKIAATECLGVLVHRGVSKALIVDRLVTALQGMKTRDPAVVVAVAKLWDEVCSKLRPKQIFTLAIPHMLDLSLSGQLTVDQFQQFMKIIRSQIAAVEKEQIKELAHNKASDDDDWLNEPAIVTRPSTQAVPAAVPAAEPSAWTPPPTLAPAPAPGAAALPAITPVPSTATKKLQPTKASFGMAATSTGTSKKLPELPPPTFRKGPTTTPQPNTQTSSMPPPLIPSSTILTPTPASASQTSSSPGLMSFTPLQPKPASNEFGSFVSNTPQPNNTSQFDSLI